MRGGDLVIRVSRDELLEKLRENRTKHEADFQLALEGYTKLAIKELEDKLEAVKAGTELDQYLSNVKPIDHTGDYDDAIDMLEMSRDSEIELSQSQFKMYVKDDWGWKRDWIGSNAVYAAAAS